MSFLSLVSKSLSVPIQNVKTGCRRNIFWHRDPIPDPFTIIRARKEDYCDVINLLWKSYYPDEPTFMALKLGYMYQPVFDELAYTYLEDGLSYVAKCSFTYEVVGGCINTVCSPWEPNDMDRFACKLPSPELQHLYQFRAYVQRAPCLWEKYCTDKIFEGNKSCVVVRAQPQDHTCIAELMWKYYYPFEPTVSSLGLGEKFNPIFDEHALRDLAENLSVLAKCKQTGNISGVCINVSTCPWDADNYEKLAVSSACPQLRKLFKFYAYLHRAPCLFEKYGVDKLYEMKTMFVRTEDRNKGIGRLLLESSLSLGTRRRYKVIRCDATSIYTDRLCTKLKMKMVHDIPYCSYTGDDPEHTPVFKAPPPHTGCRVFIDTPLYEYNK
ncbi:hypothetical protein RN001_004226 [Aquatica leii]|uniref:aralkylamine N-acetyltransferase n=1 Tax=Aquatica leii TaxID=1421715 RepID=A0AAN7SHC4_9COLE|nr:hypothetical protein RN001_004226 [Aquatica leii]